MVGLAAFLAMCFGAAGVGSLFTAPAIPTWYTGLAKPSWTPPSWVFGPVWSLLYLAMAIAAWMVWRRGARAALSALALFGVQLALNVAWSATFFGLRMPGAAFGVIVALWLFILATLIAFRRRSLASAILMAPYLAWVSFAAALNFAVWRMNPRSPA